MTKEKIIIDRIPAVIWGENSSKVYLFVHGKMSDKESARTFAELAARKGYQTISFDLPEHGERTDKDYRCNIWNGIKDLTTIGDYVFQKWEKASLFGCSLGAFFSLHAYKDRPFENCLFQSPVLNMEYLIQQMLAWFQISEEQLKQQGEIPTPIDLMSWQYYQYVKEHPISEWKIPTHILYGAMDNLQSRSMIEDFVSRFQCQLTISESSEHPFMEESDKEIVATWMNNNIH